MSPTQKSKAIEGKDFEKLLKTVQEYISENGKKEISWNTILKRSQLMGYEPKQLCQRYQNYLKKVRERSIRKNPGGYFSGGEKVAVASYQAEPLSIKIAKLLMTIGPCSLSDDKIFAEICRITGHPLDMKKFVHLYPTVSAKMSPEWKKQMKASFVNGSLAITTIALEQLKRMSPMK